MPSVRLFDRIFAKLFPGGGELRRFFRGAHAETLVRFATRDGVVFGLDPEGHIDRAVILGGYYEREVLAAAFDGVPHGGVFWDVGANFGLHALTVKRLRPDVTVVAFEPVPAMAARIRNDANRNNLEITLLPVALGERPGYATMNVRVHQNGGLSSLAARKSANYEWRELTRIESGDDLVSLGVIPAPSFLKIDVEGFEAHVLAGLRETLASPSVAGLVVETAHGGEDLGIEPALEAAAFSLRPVDSRNTLAFRADAALRDSNAA